MLASELPLLRTAGRGADEPPRAEADDPLAGLARLIAQSVPMNKLGRDRRPATWETAHDRRGELDHASDPAPNKVFPKPTNDRYSAPEDERNSDQVYRQRSDERYEQTSRANEPARYAADGELGAADDVAYHETADWQGQSSLERDSDYPDECEDKRLARLIAQSVPMNKLGRDRRPATWETAHDRRGELDHASDPAPNKVFPKPTNDRYSAPEDERNSDQVYRQRSDERYEQTSRANPPSPSRVSRFRPKPFAREPARYAADGELGAADDVAYHETADWQGQSSLERDSDYPDECEDKRDAEGDVYSEDQNTGRHGGFILVAAVFALAVLGTAGAFAYRAMSGDPTLPALPPIIKAERDPNKIIPSGVRSQDSTGRDADVNDAAPRQQPLSREERPVDISPPVTSAAPRPASTVPAISDPPPMGGPGAIIGYSTRPTSSNPAMSTESPALTAPAMTTATVAPSVNHASAPAAGPSISTARPTAPGPKKIRTVTIRTDQSGTPDAAAGSSPSVPARPGTQSPQGSNEPLSILPSSMEGSAAPARPRGRL